MSKFTEKLMRIIDLSNGHGLVRPVEWIDTGFLFLPRNLILQRQKTSRGKIPEPMAIYITHREAFPAEDDSFTLLEEELKALNGRDVLLVASNIAFLLHTQNFRSGGTERQLYHQAFPLEISRRIDRFIEKQVDKNVTAVFIHRLQLLQVMKMAILSDHATDRKVEGNREKFGRILLRTNSFLEQDWNTERDNSSERITDRVRAFAIRNMFLNGSENFRILLGRWWDILCEAPKRMKSRGAALPMDIDAAFSSAFGVSIEFSFTTLFVINTYYINSEEALKTNMQIDLEDGYFSNIQDAPAAEMKCLLSHWSCSKEDLAKNFDGLSHLDFEPFYRFPILKSGERFRILDHYLFEESATEGIFWKLHDHLSQKSKRQNDIPDKERKLLLQTRGALVEDYAREILKRICKPDSSSWDEGKYGIPGGADCVIREGDSLIILEICNSVLSRKALLSGDSLRIEIELRKNLYGEGRSKIGQLLETKSAFLSGKLNIGIKPADITNIFLVLVTAQDLPMFPGVWSLYEQSICKASAFAPTPSDLKNLELLSFEDLEILDALSEKGHKFSTLLKEKHNGPGHRDSFKNFSIYSGKWDRAPSSGVHKTFSNCLDLLSSRAEEIFKKENS